MMELKNAIYLTPFEDELNTEERREVELFANKHGLQVIGESHYPFLIPIENPKDFLNILSKMNADTFICDDKCLVYADIYNDGELARSIRQKGITIYHKELNCELERICSVLSEDMKKSIKNAVSESLQELKQEMKMNGQIAVMTNNADNSVFKEYIEILSERFGTKIPTICMDEYHSEMKSALENYLKNNNINKVIVYNPKMITPEFKETIDHLSVKCNFIFKDDFDMELMETDIVNTMKLN